jgi:3-methyladenine DNA glycosylase/8-oxoguanine DNA glycosylase
VLKYCQSFAAVIELLDTIPGVGRQIAEMVVSEIGVDMSRFPVQPIWRRGQA